MVILLRLITGLKIFAIAYIGLVGLLAILTGPLLLAEHVNGNFGYLYLIHLLTFIYFIGKEFE